MIVDENVEKIVRPFEKEIVFNLLELIKRLSASPHGILLIDDWQKYQRNFNGKQIKQLLVTNEDLSKYINGIVTSMDSLGEMYLNKTFAQWILENNLIVGVNIFKTFKRFRATNELYTVGGDDLNLQLQKCYDFGCRLARWRAMFKVGDVEPTSLAIEDNVCSIARFVLAAQFNRMVPMIEIRLEAGAYNILQAADAFTKILTAIFHRLICERVCLECLILCIPLVAPGAPGFSPIKIPILDKIMLTYKIITRTVPTAVHSVMIIHNGSRWPNFITAINCLNKFRLENHTFFWSMNFVLNFPFIKRSEVDLEQNEQMNADKLNEELNTILCSLNKACNGELSMQPKFKFDSNYLYW